MGCLTAADINVGTDMKDSLKMPKREGLDKGPELHMAAGQVWSSVDNA